MIPIPIPLLFLYDFLPIFLYAFLYDFIGFHWKLWVVWVIGVFGMVFIGGMGW